MLWAFPARLFLPEDAPPDLRKLGLAARVAIMTERAEIVAIVGGVPWVIALVWAYTRPRHFAVPEASHGAEAPPRTWSRRSPP